MLKKVTSKQLEANKRNAKLGGVKSDVGKAVSRLNAIKHNVLGTVMANEEANDAVVIQTRFTIEFDPQSTIEEILIERMSIWYIRIQRAVKAEAEQIKRINDPDIIKVTGGFELLDLGETREITHVGYNPKVKNEDIELLEKTYLRYEGSLESKFYKAYRELQRVQATRRGDPTSPTLDADADLEDK